MAATILYKVATVGIVNPRSILDIYPLSAPIRCANSSWVRCAFFIPLGHLENIKKYLEGMDLCRIFAKNINCMVNTHEILVVRSSSKKLVTLIEKLRNRKESQLDKLRKQTEYTYKINI